MASVREILRNPMHKEIEKMKTKLSKEAWALPWSDYRKIIAKEMAEFLGPSWRDRVVEVR